MSKQNGNLGNAQVLASMQTAVAQQRAAGQTTVPIAWVDSWIGQLQADYGGGAYPYGYPSPYESPFVYNGFHPIDTFMPLFSDNVTFRTTTTLK